MLTKYIKAAMSKAKIEKLENGLFYADIRQCPGVWAQSRSSEKCLAELQEVLEAWIVLKLRDGDYLPSMGGVKLEANAAKAS